MNNRVANGFTLIELLISISIGLVLLGVTAGALSQVARVAKRDAAQRQAHDDIGTIYRALDQSLGVLHQGTQLRIEADPGANGFGTGDERITMIWMSPIWHHRLRTAGQTAPMKGDLVWNQLEWRGDRERAGGEEAVGGTLFFSTSSRSRMAGDYQYEVGGVTYDTGIEVTPQSRRDRERDLNDNDLRYLPGITPAEYVSIGMPGDRDDLVTNSRAMHAPTTKVVTTFDNAGTMVTYPVFSWVDAGGYTVTCDPKDGIQISGGLSPASLKTSESDFYESPNDSNTHVFAIDGTFLDGRSHLVDGREVMAWRPALMRIRVPLVTNSRSGLDLSEEPTFNFALSIFSDAKLPYQP